MGVTMVYLVPKFVLLDAAEKKSMYQRANLMNCFLDLGVLTRWVLVALH